MIKPLDFISGQEQYAGYLNAEVFIHMAAESAPRRQRILIVEDEPLIAVALESALREFGFEVAGSVTRVSAALELIGREEIDGAILDVNLGPQRADPIADALAARDCPFFFMTGYGVADVPARHAGRAVLQKPFRFDQLLTALRAEFGSSPCGLAGIERGASRAQGDRKHAEHRPSASPAPSL
ncbi:MAG: response regulator [Beijerinckiaceae bacterium]|nr:response regulator [Beijerinckiaceae bacterium]